MLDDPQYMGSCARITARRGSGRAGTTLRRIGFGRAAADKVVSDLRAPAAYIPRPARGGPRGLRDHRRWIERGSHSRLAAGRQPPRLPRRERARRVRLEIDDTGGRGASATHQCLQSDLDRGSQGRRRSCDCVSVADVAAMRNAQTSRRDFASGAKHRTFPNSGIWSQRADRRGRMPVSTALPYQWYDKPNTTLHGRDFDAFLAERRLPVMNRVVLAGGRPWG